MSEQVDNFRAQLRAKVDDADKWLKDLQANVKNAGDKAKNDAKAHLASLESKVKAQHTKAQAAEASMKAWVEEKKTITNEKIAEWKAQRQMKDLTRRADRTERYAADATEVAAAAIDEAEKAIAEAIVARMDADSAQSAPAAKSR